MAKARKDNPGKKLILWGPRPASKKNMMRRGRGGGLYKDTKIRASEDEWGAIVHNAIVEMDWKQSKCPVRINLVYHAKMKQFEIELEELPYRQNHRRWDIQNCIALICDVLEKAAYNNDAQITDIRIREEFD